MQFTGLHHVQIAIPEGGEDSARAFYRDVLGLEEVPKPPALAVRGGCWFRSPGVELHLGIDPDFTPAGKAHPALLVHGLDELAQRLSVAGVELAWDDDFPWHRHFYVQDPHGNRLEFLEPLTHA